MLPDITFIRVDELSENGPKTGHDLRIMIPAEALMVYLFARSLMQPLP